MSTTILTPEQIETLFREHDDLYAFGHAIEQAVLQSEQVQAWKRDAERYRTLRKQEIMVSMTYDGNTGATPWISSNELDSCADSLASSMEKQP